MNYIRQFLISFNLKQLIENTDKNIYRRNLETIIKIKNLYFIIRVLVLLYILQGDTHTLLIHRYSIVLNTTHDFEFKAFCCV